MGLHDLYVETFRGFENLSNIVQVFEIFIISVLPFLFLTRMVTEDYTGLRNICAV